MRSPEERALYNYMVAQLYARNGNVDDALEFLKKALEEGYKDTNKIQRDAAFASLREDPRFAQILKRQPADLK
jgi:pentatricopeptide repeat protein